MNSPMSNNPNHLLSIAETAKFLGVSEKTVRRKIAAEDLRASRVGAQWRIRPEDIEAYLARNGNNLSYRVH
ncbi:helix-turn-helix domain-containing protein [Aliiruegeria sabulilitoris]|uniref:helix-turn-helix domain-containing protein n=1 Tax=Aliiruegeria sabulilitoris TaxID=1510458 RepID=UPI00082B8FD4|nr:helix-turn-helix domain-containing protein [Aliiruegeria sabulilitoris]NDR57913.1 helix-turn-helix domain-containing protein [Pseudoruegeria sp. M32A2M]